MRSRRSRLSTVLVAPILALGVHSPITQPVGHLPVRPVAHRSPSSVRARPKSSDATSTDTKDWACIRWNESRNGLNPNIYQFQGSAFQAITGLDHSPGSYPRAVQNRAALEVYAWWQHADGIGFHPWLADRYVCDLPW